MTAQSAGRWIGRAAVLPWWLLLAVLPFFPSQDGPAHLSTADAFLALVQGDAAAHAFLEADTSLLTNWAGTLALAGLMALGFGPSLAESLLLGGLGLLWVEVFVRCGERLGRSPWAAWLVLPILVSRLTFMGFWSFLFGVGFGLWAFVLRSSGPRSESRLASKPRLAFWRGLSSSGARSSGWHLAAVAATLSHPLGGLVFLGLAASEEVLGSLSARRAGTTFELRVLGLAPHVALWLVATFSGLGGSSRSRWPSPSLPDFGGFTFATGPALGLDEVTRLLLAAGLLLWCVLGWSGLRSRPEGVGDRSVLAFAGAFAAVALGSFLTSLGPEMIGGGSHLRSRGAFAAWSCLLLAAPLVRLPAGRRWLEAGGAGLALLAALPAFAAAHQQAAQQSARLAELPIPEPGAILLGGYGSGWLDGAYRRTYNAPDLHVIQRWAADHRVLDLGNYQFHTGHFPLVAHQRFHHKTMEAVFWFPERLPWSSLAGVADLAVLRRADDPARRAALACRAGQDWRLATETDSWIVLEAREDPALDQRAAAPIETLRVAEKPDPVSVSVQGPVQIDLGEAYACWAWRAKDEKAAVSGAERPDSRNLLGLFDAEGKTEVRAVPTEDPRPLVLKPQ